MSLDTIEQAAPPYRSSVGSRLPEKRRQRLSTGVLIAVVGVLLLIGLASTNGSARFALSDAFDEVQLPTVSLPGFATVAGLRAALPARPRSASCPAGCADGGRCWPAPSPVWLSSWAS